MLKRIIKAVTFAVTIVCLLVCMLPVYAFADVVEFTEAATLGASIVDLYGMANNTSLAYEAVTESSALTEVITLYQDYQSSASDPYTLAAIGAAAAAAGAIAVVYDAVTGQGYVQLYQEQYISSLDGFWDYQLADSGLVRDAVTDLFTWPYNNGTVEPVLLARTVGDSPLVGYASSDSSIQVRWANGTSFVSKSSSGFESRLTTSTPNLDIYLFAYLDGSSYNFGAVSESTFSYFTTYKFGTPDVYGTSANWANSAYDNSTHLWYANSLYLVGQSGATLYVPLFNSVSTALSSFSASFNGSDSDGLLGGAVFLQPEFYVGDPLTAVPTIDIPNVADPNYLPQPMRINTGIEWDPLWGDPVPAGETAEPGIPYPVTDPSILNDAVPEIWKVIVEGTSAEPVPDPDPDPDNPSPNEVYTPILPVTLPSFNFSFSGIWHYVREWVSSLGAWFTTLFAIWSKLPYSMVVPVYATAVVVIVLGVYKRFFM